MTAIQWTDATWNPTTGCDRVSPGCAYCYALILAARLKAMGQPRYQLDGDPKTSGPGFALTLHADKLEQPLRWRKPRRVFVNSMSDLFHEEVPDEFIERVFVVMARASQHTFQVLTKRPERALRLLSDPGTRNFIVNTTTSENTGKARARGYTGMVEGAQPRWPLPNVWLGTSIENARFTWRADVLREIPAAVRFISAEPLLGSLFADRVRSGNLDGGPATTGAAEGGAASRLAVRAPLDLTGIDWLIVGGESGPDHRPVEVEWVRELRDACLTYAVEGVGRVANLPPRPAFFFKQWGGRTPKAGGRLLDGREWSEYPQAVPA